MELAEIAPGIDIERDILAHMDFEPIVRVPKLMDPRIFLDVIVLLAAAIQALSLMVSQNSSARKRQLAGWPDRRVDGRAKRKRGPVLALRQQETRNNVAPIGVLGKSEGE